MKNKNVDLILKEYWDEKADKYHPNSGRICAYKNKFVRNLRKKIIEKYIPNEQMTILDIGCGEGYMLKKYYAKNYRTIAIDISLKLLLLAREYNHLKHAFIASITELPFKDDTFDLVFCIELSQYIKDIDKAIKNMSRVLKAGGRLFLALPNSEFFMHQRRLSKGEDLSDKSEIWFLHQNKDIYLALQENGMEIEKIEKIPYNFLPFSLCFAQVIIGRKLKSDRGDIIV